MKITRHNLKTDIEWQCAHNAASHAEKSKRVSLTYDTPKGDLTLTVATRRQEIHVTKKG